MPGRARVVFKWKVLRITPGLRRGRLCAQPPPVLPGRGFEYAGCLTNTISECC